MNPRRERAWWCGLGLLAVACGPLPPQTSDTADDTTTGDATTAPTTTVAATTTTGTTDTTEPQECVPGSVCGLCTICNDDGKCVDDPGCCGYLAPDGARVWRCQPPPECYDDDGCPSGYACDDFVCSPIQQVTLPPCEPAPVELSDWLLSGPPSDLGLVDLDGDGDLDLFAAIPSAAAIELAFNDGAGNFSGGGTVDVGPPVGAIHSVAGDLDNDGDVDLVAARPADAEVRLLLQQDGKFSPGPLLSSTWPMSTITAVDFESDGDLDLAAPLGNEDGLALWTNDGQWSVQTWADLFPGARGVGHFTSDTVVDVLLVSQSTVQLFASVASMNEQWLAFSHRVPPDWWRPSAAQLGGGGLEVLAFGGLDGRVRVWRSVGLDVWVDAATDYVSTAPLLDGLDADFTGDGLRDLIVATGDTRLAVLAGDGADGLACELLLPVPAPTTPELLAVGDLDGDGRADVVLGVGDATGLVIVRAP